MRLDITQVGPAEGIARAAVNRAHVKGLRGAAGYWHAKLLPLRFEPTGASRYAMAPRSKSYVRAKLRQGRNGTLTYSGALAKAALKGQVEIKSTGKGATVKMRGLPDYIVMRRKSPEDRMRMWNDAVARGADPETAAARVGIQFDRALENKLRGEWRAQNRGKAIPLEVLKSITMQALTPPRRYPNIRKEMVVTPEFESKRLNTIYQRDGVAALLADPKRNRRTRRKLT